VKKAEYAGKNVLGGLRVRLLKVAVRGLIPHAVKGVGDSLYGTKNFLSHTIRIHVVWYGACYCLEQSSQWLLAWFPHEDLMKIP
jgi:hypothetical protein